MSEGSYTLLEVDISEECSLSLDIDKCKTLMISGSTDECKHMVVLNCINDAGYLYSESKMSTGSEIYEYLLDLSEKLVEIDEQIYLHFYWYKIKYVKAIINSRDLEALAKLVINKVIYPPGGRTEGNEGNEGNEGSGGPNSTLITSPIDEMNEAIGAESLTIVKYLEHNGWDTQSGSYYHEAILTGNESVISYIVRDRDIALGLFSRFVNIEYEEEGSEIVFEWLIVYINDSGKGVNTLEEYWNDSRLDKLTENDIRLKYVVLLDAYGYLSADYCIYHLFGREFTKEETTITLNNGNERVYLCRSIPYEENGKTEYRTNPLITKFLCDEILGGESNLTPSKYSYDY